MDEDQVKLEEQLITLPKRQEKTIDQLKYHKLTTNMIPLKTDTKCKSIHIYKIKSEPILTTEQKYSNASVYISKRMKEHLKQFAYVRQNLIITSTCFTTTQRSLKLVYGNTPYQIWLYHRKSINLQSTNQIYYTSPHHHKTKSYLNRTISKFLQKLNFTNLNNNFHYLPQMEYNSLLNCSILQGYKTHFSWKDQTLFLCAKPTTKIIQGNSVLDEINSFYKQQSSLSKDQKRILLNEKYKGQQIISNYGKKTIYWIQQLIFGANINQIYVECNNKKIALPQYYQDKYQLVITNLNQPLIRPKNKKQPIYLLPQFMSFILSIERNISKRKVLKKTRLASNQQVHQNINFLMNLKQPIHINPFQIFTKIGIELQQYIQVNSYQLELPTIKMRDKKFSFQDEQIYSAQIDLNICLICSNQFNITNLKNDIIRYTNKSGISHNFISYTYLSSKKQEIIYDIKKIVYIQKYTNRRNMTNMFWIVIASQFKSLYPKLKQITNNTNIQIASQITLEKKLEPNKNSTIIQQIIYQMAAKVGNKLWVVDKNISSLILMIGIAHKKSKEGQTVIAYCCNIDVNISKYYSNFYIQQPYSSLSLTIKDIVSQSILQFFKANQDIPNQIIIVRFENRTINREQQIAQCKEIQKSINNMNLGRSKPKINYYALSYSKNLQVYLKNTNQFVRPFQGMVIDSQIVDNGNFYIMHEDKQTSSTIIVSYRRIFSNSLFSFLEFKQLMYNQTFKYFNYKGTVYFPSILKYAYKLAVSLCNYQYKSLQVDKLKYNLYFL